MANYVCTQIGLSDTDDVAAAQLFLRNYDEIVYNNQLWKDALIGVDFQFNPATPPNNDGIMLVPPVIDIVVAARVNAAPGSWGNALRIHGMEDYYRVDWDWFQNCGYAVQFAEMTPCWFEWFGAGGLQLVNLNIADSGQPCELIWYDGGTETKHVQVGVPGTQFSPGGINQPPVAVPTVAPIVPALPPTEDLVTYGNDGGNPPAFTPVYGVAIRKSTGPLDGGRIWYYANGQWS
jgi:hypothetical protein